jgi:hypothetical protein
MDEKFDPNILLNRQLAMQQGYTPTGRKVGIVPLSGYNLYKVMFVDSKPGPKDVTDIDGMFTRAEYAKDALDEYLEKMWNMSDAATRKSKAEVKSGADAG